MSNFYYNNVQIGGKLTRDPELKTTGSGVTLTDFTIAVNDGKDQNGDSKAYFFKVTAWRQTAEFVTRYFRKGSSIFITGKLVNKEWTGTDGAKRVSTEITADRVYFVDSRAESPLASTKITDGDGTFAPKQESTYIPDAYKAVPAPKMEEVDPDSEELPF